MSDITVFKDVHLYDEYGISGNEKCMIVKDGVIQFIGDNLPKIKGPFNCVEGGYISRPFCDYHFHLPGSLLFDMFGVNLCNCNSIDEYADYLQERSKGLQIIRGFGWEVESLRYFFSKKDMVSPLQFLDNIFPERPAILYSLDFHSCWCNSVALDLLKKEGIRCLYEDKEIPNGAECILHEHIADKIFRSENFSFSRTEIKKAVLLQQEQLICKGITEIYSLMFIGVAYDQMLDVLHELDLMGMLKVKIKFACTVYPDQTKDDITNAINLGKKYQSKKIKLVAIKIYLDGVIDNHSAFLLNKYEDGNGCGFCLWSNSAMRNIIELSISYGLPLHIHAIGDGAVKIAVDQLSMFPTPKTGRHIIAHIQLCDEITMKKMALHDIVACMQPFWFYRGQRACKVDLLRLGSRVYDEYPVKSLINNGVKVIFSSDYPATDSFDPIVGMSTAAYNDDNREVLTMREGYMAYYEGSYENKSVAFKTGDDATFIILDSDITENCEAKVVATYLNGKLCYKIVDL